MQNSKIIGLSKEENIPYILLNNASVKATIKVFDFGIVLIFKIVFKYFDLICFTL